MNALSPELALIDDEIDRRAESARAVDTNPELLPGPSVGLQTRRPTLPVAVVLACLAVLAVTLLMVGPGGRDPASTDLTARTSDTADGRTAPELHWKPVPNAQFYNVILWHEGERVLDLWPTKPFVSVSTKGLPPGRYQWFVYPRLGNGAKGSYGHVAAHGTLNV